MTLKVKMEQIVDAIPAMDAFAQKELPAKAAYRVAKLLRKMASENRDFQAGRDAIIKKHGTPTVGKPNRYDLAGDAKAAADAELEQLLGAEVELEGCAMVAWADIENLSLAPAVLTDLEAFIEAPPA